MNMFELFKYMNGSFFFSSIYKWRVFSDFSYKSISKSSVDTPPSTRSVNLKHELCLSFLYALNIEMHITVLFHFCHSFPIQEPLVRRKSAAVKPENEINHQQHKHRTVINHNKRTDFPAKTQIRHAQSDLRLRCAYMPE